LFPAGEVDGDSADFWFHIHPLIILIRGAVALSGWLGGDGWTDL
jgi:hypothetical protein